MMEMKPQYTPISVEDVTDFDPQKGSIRAKRVNYKLADGTASYLVIHHDQYTAENVQAQLQAAADHHASVMGIRGPTFPATPSSNQQGPFG
jgi:hypothetical protein